MHPMHNSKTKRLLMKIVYTLIIAQLICFKLFAQTIHLNQIGFNQNQTKYAAVPNANADLFQVIDAATGEVVFEDSLSEIKYWAASDENVQIADFSNFNRSGEYYITANGQNSHTFPIKPNGAYSNVSKWILKGFYMWRASTAIESQYAMFNDINYARNAGHPDNVVYVHSSAASAERPEGTIISAPKGWYDAGDYNKYVVNASPAVYPMLLAYMHNKSYFQEQDLNIPESNNSIPDILDEIKWELDWLLAMQDPNDGGIYTKLTHKSFSAITAPENATAPRYVVAKSTAASLDFAAMLAKSSVVFKELMPEFSQTCLQAAIDAYDWAVANPAVYFDNPSDISTGGYGDQNVTDEFFWARAELFLATNNTSYLNQISSSGTFDVPGWRTVNTFGLMSLVEAADSMNISEAEKQEYTNKLISLANSIKTNAETSPYKVSANSFYWGSNGTVASQGMILAQAARILNDENYFTAAQGSFDYLLGRNATGYSFVTGFGSKTPMHIHDRRSEGDNIAPPIPGYVAGGPNPNNMSGDCGSSEYPSSLPAKAYLDKECSFSTNEIAINWNGPLVYLAAAIDSRYRKPVTYVLNASTNPDGSEIILQMNNFISGDFRNDDIEISVHDSIYAIDTILFDAEISDSAIIKLNGIIINSSDSIAVNYEGSGLKYRGNEIGNFQTIAKNNTPLASPYVSFVSMSETGLEILIQLNKNIAFDSSMVRVVTNGRNLIRTIGYGSDSSKIIINTIPIFDDNIVALILNEGAFSSFGIASKATQIYIENNAPEAPGKATGATIADNGYSISIHFSNSIYIDNLTGLTIENKNRGNIEIISSLRDGSNLVLYPATRLNSSDTLSILYNGTGITTIGNYIVDPFTIDMVVNLTPPMQDTIEISKGAAAQIENENFSYNNGFVVEDCTDEGGGSNLGYSDAGDWADYIVNVIDSGYYAVGYRTASESATGTVGLYKLEGKTPMLIKKTKLLRTGGWQRWESVYDLVYLEEGIQYLRIKAETNLFNLNYFSIDPDTSKAPQPPQVSSVESNSTSCISISPKILSRSGEIIMHGTSSEVGYQIFSSNGALMQEGTTFTNSINLNVREAGCYFLKIRNENKSSTFSFIAL